MKHIVIADDDSHVIRILKMTLEREGYEVTPCRNGEEALQTILQRQPDALVTDITMPRMTGADLCMAIQEKIPERQFPIIVMTASTEREERGWVEGIPNLMLMEKPVSPRRLTAMLDKHFGQQ